MEELTEVEISKLRGVSILDILGIPSRGRRVGIPCPIHDGTNLNFNIYPDNSYFCFKCNATGQNAIDFMRDLKGYPMKMSREQFIDVAVELSQYCG